MDLLFIHHSCGGQLLALPGPEASVGLCIYTSHPNGGGLRKTLEEAGYVVHEASYGSRVGEETDLFDWLPKFRDRMAEVLSVDWNDRPLPGGRRNRIVLLKSCFPNSEFLGEGAPPGRPEGSELTFWNAQATLSALLGEFRKAPDVLFVYLTAPPLAPKTRKEPLWKWISKKALGRPVPADRRALSATIARKFNDWVKSPEGWLNGYPLKNVAVFDLFDVLTGHGGSDLSAYPTGDGTDSHPSRSGNEAAAAEIVPFLNRVVHRAGLSG